MKKEIKLFFDIQDKSYTITYLLYGETLTAQFIVRCPTEKWNYYLPMDLGYHSDTPIYEEQTLRDCDFRPSGKCYYDGSSLQAQELWDKFEISGEEETIWKTLEEVLNHK